MDPLFTRILKGQRQRLFGTQPLFEPHKPANDLIEIERQLGATLPAALREWLVTAGYGDVNEVLSFRREWFNVLDRGELKGHVLFAQDVLGNFYSFSQSDGTIHFVSRSAPEYALLATDFLSFMEQFEQRGFQLEEWTNALLAQRYDWRT